MHYASGILYLSVQSCKLLPSVVKIHNEREVQRAAAFIRQGESARDREQGHNNKLKDNKESVSNETENNKIHCINGIGGGDVFFTVANERICGR